MYACIHKYSCVVYVYICLQIYAYIYIWIYIYTISDVCFVNVLVVSSWVSKHFSCSSPFGSSKVMNTWDGYVETSNWWSWMVIKWVVHSFLWIISVQEYPLVMTNIASWKITMFNGNIHYFYGHFPVRYVANYQRVNAQSILKKWSHLDPKKWNIWLTIGGFCHEGFWINIYIYIDLLCIYVIHLYIYIYKRSSSRVTASTIFQRGSRQHQAARYAFCQAPQCLGAYPNRDSGG